MVRTFAASQFGNGPASVPVDDVQRQACGGGAVSLAGEFPFECFTRADWRKLVEFCNKTIEDYNR